jgi:hypothetical protein
MGSLLCALLGVQFYLEVGNPPPCDLAPDLRVEAPPYRPVDTCPQRIWAAGDYLPIGCIRGNLLDRRHWACCGLEAPRDVAPRNGRPAWSDYRQRHWVRMRDDVLLVAGPRDASARVLKVIPDRLRSTSPGPVFEPEPDRINYRAMPADYVAGAAIALAIPVITAALALGLTLHAVTRRESQGRDGA